MRKKVILLGIDGASWSILAPLISQGKAPNFQKLLSRSVAGTLQSTDPPHSPPAWTSMFTGVNPGKHGIVDFLLRENNRFVPCLSRYRMCKSIWHIAGELGRKCVVINEPVTFPPEEINGMMVTGLMTPPGSSNWIYPAELRGEINLVAGGYETDIPADFVSILYRDRKSAAKFIEDLAFKVFRVSKHAATKLDWDLLAIIFTSTDRLQHYWWNDQSEISRHYGILDAMLGDYIEYANQRQADIIIVSDHGFGPAERLFRLDKWLQESGLTVFKESTYSTAMSKAGVTKKNIANLWRGWRAAFDLLPGFVQNALRKIVPESGRQIDSEKSGALAVGSGIFINPDKKEYVASELRKVTDAKTGALVFESVKDRDSVLQGPYSYRAPDLFLQPAPGFYCTPWDMFKGIPVDEYDKIFTGFHRPEGIFIHYQPDKSPSTPTTNPLRPWDVAALVLAVLGIPLPDYFDGKPPSYFSES